MSWTVDDVMTRDPVAVREETSFKEIAALLAEHRFGSVPVVDSERRPIGIVTEEDLALKAEPKPSGPYPLESKRHRETRAKAAAAKARELMSPPVRLVTPGASVSEAARILHHDHAHALLVIDQADRLIGIVTRADVLKVFLRPDAELETAIEREIAQLRRAFPDDKVTATVRDGLAVIEGETWVRSACERIAAHAASVPGIVGVDNRVRYRVDDYLLDLATIYR